MVDSLLRHTVTIDIFIQDLPCCLEFSNQYRHPASSKENRNHGLRKKQKNTTIHDERPHAFENID
jgi:hypothetical protein